MRKTIRALYVFVVPIPENCPAGYDVTFQNSCYKYVSDKQSRSNAAYTCSLDGAHLADLQSLEEHSFIAQLLQDINAKDTWFGLLRKPDGSDPPTYVWSDGSSLNTSQEAWAPGEPNEYRNGVDCVRLRKETGFAWADRDCGENFNSICELEGKSKWQTQDSNTKLFHGYNLCNQRVATVNQSMHVRDKYEKIQEESVPYTLTPRYWNTCVGPWWSYFHDWTN